MAKSLFRKFIMAIACVAIIAINPLNSFATETFNDANNHLPETQETYSVDLLSQTNSFTWSLPYGSGSIVEQKYMGFNPTVTVTARGNSNMVYKVWVVNPAGITGVVGYVRADGSTISKNLWMSIGGNYFIHLQPWEGTTNNNTVYFDFNLSW